MSAFPPVTVKNQLTFPFVIYDAFRSEPGAPSASSPDTYFGTLTPLATLAPGASKVIIPIHGPISTYLAYNTSGAPLAREFTLGTAPAVFSIDDSDTSRMASTNQFLDAITANPNGSLATGFKTLLNGASPAVAVDQFFSAHPPYQSCTFVSYLMAIAAKASQTPGAVQSTTYSLSTLCNYLGGTWPPGFPDISVTDFTCSNDDDTLTLGGNVDLSSLPYAPGAADFIRSILPSPSTVEATFQFHYGFDLGIFGTRIQFQLPQLKLVGSVVLQNPTITLDINPAFQFVVFTAKASIPFSLFGNPPFNAIASLVMDNEEAEVGVVIDGNSSSLLTPPVMKGVHFDQFGVGMGLFFEPPSYAIGVQGKFHIGDGGTVALDDDTFVVVCALDGDVPDPLYISFYVPKMDLGDVVTIFTDSSASFGLPVSVTDLSFQWAQNPLEPVALPDGSLSTMGYGFSGNLQLLDFSFYGDVEIGASGLQGNLTMAPWSAGPLKLTGNGPGVSMKFDAAGNPIRNNQIATTKAIRDAIANATMRQIVAPGGPSLTVSTSSSPFLSLGAGVSLFDAIDQSVAASVSSSGISFELDYGSVLSSKMACTLQDFHNFSGTFQYGLDTSIPLPSVAGFSLGSIPLEATIDATLGITTSTSDVSMSVGGGFDFEGVRLSIGPFSVDVDISRISDLISAIGSWILDHVAEIFGDFLSDAGKWAKLVFNGVIQGVDDVAQGLKTAFGQTEAEVASIMSSVGYGIDQAAKAIGNAFSAGAQDVASALSSGYGAASNVVAGALQSAGYAITDISQALANVFGEAPAAINDILQGIGYTSDQVKDAFESLGGDFASWADSVWGTIKHIFNPSNW